MTDTTQSPLKKYKRQPKIYINLPSEGKFYKSGVLHNDTAYELPVFSMTANDEILYKTPDALINGKATTENIRSCIPSVNDPWSLVTLDVDTILMSMRLASYGPYMNINSKCKHCSENNTYDLELQKFIDYFNSLTFDDNLTVGDFKFKIRPLTYREYTDIQKNSVTLQRALRVQAPKIENEEEKNQFIDQCLNNIARMTLDAIMLSVVSIEIDGETETNKDEIVDFLNSNDRSLFSELKSHIDAEAEKWKIPDQSVVCGGCKKEYTIKITLDQTDFFGKG